MKAIDRARYRAKRTTDNAGEVTDSGDWVVGGLIHTMHRTAILLPCEKSLLVDPETVGQFTGLKDKNGVDIFEGMHIRNLSGRVCVVEWHAFTGQWDCIPVGEVGNTDSLGFEPHQWCRAVEVVK